MSDEVSGYPGAPPGWYPDPAGGPGQRWWDGYAWTEATVQPAVPPPPPSAYSPSPSRGTAPPRYGVAPYPTMGHQGRQNAQDLVGNELRMFPAGRWAIAVPGISSLVNLIAWVSIASQWRAFGHQFHLAATAGNTRTTPFPTVPSVLGGYSSLLVLGTIAAVVLECMWQFRAATAARALQLPAKRSPGWGVAFWFIPVVNFWMPYQALRDCLAPGDANRVLVLRYWLFYVGMVAGSTLTIIGLMTSTPVGVVFSLLAGVCALGVLATAPKVVTAIAMAHRAAVNP